MRLRALLPRGAAGRTPGQGSSGTGQLESKTKGKLQKQICQVILDHFDKQYTAELGNAWSSVRDVLTSPLCWQHSILLNRFSPCTELENSLCVQGYHPAFQGGLPYLPAAFKCYIRRTPGRFPAQKHQAGKLKEYYLLNAASLLPVLALEVKDGENVLDLCAAPGGKSVAILQCACPGQFHCNEYDDLRARWLEETIESFIPEPLINSIMVSKLDGRHIGDLKPELYDKVLVDTPCSNDRSWLFSSDIHQATLRVIQRKELSCLQFQLLRELPEWDGHQPPVLERFKSEFGGYKLIMGGVQSKCGETSRRFCRMMCRSAIKALRPGGSLVYSTCTLSKAENSDVINLILNSCSNVIPVDISEMGRAVSQEFTLLDGLQQHELLVLPERGRAWGPTYVAKLKKI